MRAPGTPTSQWRSRRLLPVSLLGLLLAGLLASPARPARASSSLPPYLAEATDPAVTTLARDRHISIQEAQRRIGWQEPAMQLGEELRQALGGRYGTEPQLEPLDDSLEAGAHESARRAALG